MAEALASFHAQFAPLFGRADTQRRAAQYLRGLLNQHAERRNAENLAAVVAGTTPRAFQRLLTESRWDHGSVIDALQAFLGPLLNADDGVWVLEEIGFAKDGEHSVGVAYQRNGAVRKMGNCQVGLFLAYASSRGQALVDGRLYLPRVWTDDEERRRAAGVPASVTYQSRSDLGLALLRTARARGHLRSHWVIGAGEHGADPAFRDALDRAGWLYMLQVPASIVVFTPPAEAKMPLFSLKRYRL
jgi:SRSO17 transposase